MKTVALSEVCDIQVGRTPSRSEPSFWGRGEPWLSIADMNQGHRITKTREQITPLAASGGRQVPAGTVLLSFKLSIGKVSIAGLPLFTNEAIAALQIRDHERLDARYLLRALEGMDLAADSNRAAMGATLNKAQLHVIRIPLPLLNEQRRIAAILDQADALRAKRRQDLAHLDALAQSLFRETFRHRRDPMVRLDSLVASDDHVNYGVVQPGPHAPNGTPLIRISNLRNSAVNSSDIKLISRDIDRLHARSRIRGDEILVGCVGSIGQISLVSPELVGYNIARAIARVPIEDPTTRCYVAEYLKTATPQEYFRGETRTVAQPTLNVKQLAATMVPLPPIAIQEEFVHRIDSVSRMQGHARATQTLDHELFASLQSRAFRGEL